MKRTILVLSILMLSLGLSAGQIDGTVTYGDTDEPAADIAVNLLTNHPSDPETTVNTNESGYYIFTDLDNGFHLVYIIAEGYNPYMEQVNINGAEPEVTLDITLQPFTPPEPIGSVSGTVWNEADEPVEAATVMLMAIGGPANPFYLESATGPDGIYSFTDLPAGYFHVQAQAEGYSPSEPELIMISFEEPDLTGVDLVLEEFESPDPLGSVAGMVQDENDIPIEGASVQLFTGQGFPGDPLYFETLTGSDGSFLFGDLPLEEYDLTAFAEGYLLLEPFEIEITEENPDTTGIILVLTEFQIPDPIGSVSGVVTDQDSLPIEGAELILMLDEGEPGIPYVFEQVTDPAGAFLFSDLPAGEYELVASAEGYLPSEPLELEITEETPDITDLVIILEPWGGVEENGQVAGYIINHLGIPIANASVLITNVQNTFQQEATTDEAGEFLFAELPWGNYRLEANAEGYLTGWFSNPGGQSVPIHVNEESPILEDIYITLLPEDGGYEGSCEISMIIEGDENPSEVNHIFLYNTDNGIMYRRLMFGSEFTIGELPAGMYIVGVHTPGYMMYYYEGATTPEAADPVELLEDNPVSIVVDLTGFEPGSYIISGTITNDQGDPVEDAIVTGIPVNAGGGEGLNQFNTETDASGYYELEVCEGDYLISASATDYSVSYWPGTLDFESAVPIEVETDIMGIDLVIYPLEFNGLAISGSVTIEGELSAAAIMVVAVSIAQNEEEPYTRSVMAADDGSYEIPLDQAGEYYVLAITSGAFPVFHSEVYNWEEAELVTVNGLVADIDLDLTYPFGQGLNNISGIITNDEGEALTGVTVLMLDINNMPVAFGSTNSSGHYSISYLGNTEYTFLATKVYYESFETSLNPADQDQVDAFLNPVEGTDTDGQDIPVNTKLISNYPNPFNPETTIKFFLADENLARVNIYNTKGQKVRTIINENLPSGLHTVIWDGKDDRGNDLTSGIYLYRLTTGAKNSTRKMILLK